MIRKYLNLFLLIITIISLYNLTSSNTHAQDKFEAVLGTVNTEPITTYDLSQRIKILLKTLGLEDTMSNRDSIRKKTIDLLVEEKVKLIEGKKLKINIPEKQVLQFISKVFSFPIKEIDNFKEFLAADNIDFDILYEKIKTELVWNEIVNKKFSSLIFPNPEKVKEILDDYQKKLGLRQYNYSEIVLFKKDKKWDEIEQSMKKIYEILNKSTNFGNVASNFSESSSSLNGGNLGWISERQIDSETKSELEKIRKGKYSNIFKVTNGYKIVMLHDTGKLGEKDDKSYSLMNFSTKNEKNKLKNFKKTIKDCDQSFDALETEVTIDKIVDVKSKDLSEEINVELENKARNEKTKIMVQGGKSFFLLVCDVKGGEIQQLSPEIVEEKLFKQRLTLMANTYLNKLQKQANVDLSIN